VKSQPANCQPAPATSCSSDLVRRYVVSECHGPVRGVFYPGRGKKVWMIDRVEPDGSLRPVGGHVPWQDKERIWFFKHKRTAIALSKCFESRGVVPYRWWDDLWRPPNVKLTDSRRG